MPVANIQLLGLPSYYSVLMTGSRYPIAIDAALQVHNRLAGAFAPHASESGSPSAPNMTVTLDVGAVQNGISFAAVASQATGTITAPVTNPRRDIVYVDARTGTVGIAAGAEAASPSDPAIPAGKIAIARLNLTVGMPAIDDLDIDDLRPTPLPFNLIAYSTATIDRTADYIVFYDATDGTHKRALAADAIPSEDQVARDMALAALIAATSIGGLRGPIVSWVANTDNFSTKTNATFDTDHYHNPGGSARVTGGTPTAPFGGTAANFNDNNTGTVCLTTAVGDLSAAALSARIAFKLDLGSIKTITQIDAIGYRRDTGSGQQPTLVYSTDDVSYTQLGAALSTASETPQTESRTGSVSARYVGFAMTAVNWTGVNMQIQDLNAYEQTSPAEMTLSDDAETINADCELVDVYVLEKTVDASPTRRIRASIDGGATWAVGVLQTPDYAVSDKRLYRYQCDVSAQNVGSPSPRSLKVEYNTLNDGKEREFYRMDAVPLYA